MPTTPVSVAVVTGGHSFDVPNFHRLFCALPGIEPYIQSLDDYTSTPRSAREAYEVVLFYTMKMETPSNENQPWYAGQPLTALSELGETAQGIVVLHHAILGHPNWPVWAEIVGIPDRSFGYHIGETVTTQIACPDHPITCGLAPWTMTDETYSMAGAGDGSQILLTYDHPKSMRTIAWARQYRSSRVFCYQAGHDNDTWQDAHFREALARGIAWAARR